MDNTNQTPAAPKITEESVDTTPVVQTADTPVAEAPIESMETVETSDYDAEGQVAQAPSASADEPQATEEAPQADTPAADEPESNEPSEVTAPAATLSETPAPKQSHALVILAVTLIIVGVAVGAYGLLFAAK